MKTKLTKQQRHEYYKQATKSIKVTYGICVALAEAVYGSRMEWDKITKKNFPELYLFRRKMYNAYWLMDTDRLLVLAFCIAMTKKNN